VRVLLILLLVLMASAAGAQSESPAPGPASGPAPDPAAIPAPDPPPTLAASQAYLVARQRAVARLEKMLNGPQKEASDSQLLQALQPLLQEAIGLIPMPRGFEREMMMVPATLCCGVGREMLDGLMFFSATSDGQVLVTTEALFHDWLGRHARGAAPEAALQSAELLSMAIASNWQVTPLATLPIAKPLGATLAVAVLALGSSGVAPGPPQQLAVSVIKGGRLFIAYVDRVASDLPIAICGELFEDHAARAKAAAGDETPALPEKLKASIRIAEEGQAAFDKCWAGYTRNQNAFPTLTKEAQALADSLAAN
jgi:hypothetical protein